MDKYNSKFPLLFAPKGYTHWAITIGQTTWYSVAACQVNDAWRRHEDWHKVQWKRDGWPKFLVKYLYYQLRYGYQKNPYEIEARSKE